MKLARRQRVEFDGLAARAVPMSHVGPELEATSDVGGEEERRIVAAATAVGAKGSVFSR